MIGNHISVYYISVYWGNDALKEQALDVTGAKGPFSNIKDKPKGIKKYET